MILKFRLSLSAKLMIAHRPLSPYRDSAFFTAFRKGVAAMHVVVHGQAKSSFDILFDIGFDENVPSNETIPTTNTALPISN